MFLHGIAAFLLSPLIGLIRDITKSYAICFHTLTFCLSLCAVPWLMEFAWFWLYPKKAIKSEEKLNGKQQNSVWALLIKHRRQQVKYLVIDE